MRVVPADRRSQFDRGARPIGLVAGRVGAVEEGAVLQIDQAGEHQLGEHRLALRLVLHQPEKDAIGFEHAAAMHQRHPVVEAVAQRPVEMLGLLVRPVHDGFRRRAALRSHAAGVVARRLVDLLVPDVETGRDVPDGLRHRQSGHLCRQPLRQVQRGAGAQQAMVVVDEVDEAVVDPLVVGNVGVGPMDAHGLAQHLRQRPAVAYQIVVAFAGADLIARENAILELVVKGARGGASVIHSFGKRHR